LFAYSLRRYHGQCGVIESSLRLIGKSRRSFLLRATETLHRFVVVWINDDDEVRAAQRGQACASGRSDLQFAVF
jgi:hypothetical protein